MILLSVVAGQVKDADDRLKGGNDVVVASISQTLKQALRVKEKNKTTS